MTENEGQTGNISGPAVAIMENGLPESGRIPAVASFRLLILDPHPGERLSAITALKSEYPGLAAFEVFDRDGFERSLGQPPFDLIVTDFDLHWTDGIGLFARLNSHSPESPVIMYTGCADEDVAVSAMKAGIDDYIPKSHGPGRLAAAGRALMDRQNARNKAYTPEKRIADLMSSLDVGYFRTAKEGGSLLSANAAFLAILGFESLDQGKNRNLADLVQNAEDVARVRNEIAVSGKLRHTELRVRRVDGREIWVSLSLNSLLGEWGVWEGAIEDVTERKARAEMLTAKADSIHNAEKLEYVERLAGGIAHNLNNLLTPIIGYAELLLSKTGPGSQIHEELEAIQKAGSRAADIVANLLAFGRRQVGRLDILDMNTVLESMEYDIRKALGANIELKVLYGEGLFPIKANPRQMEKAILRLITNSKDALHPGGCVTIRTENLEIPEGADFQGESSGPREPVACGRYCSISVSDTGKGMSEEIQSRAFEPFFTTKTSGKGMGLGLSAVHGIVKQSNGHIILNSRPGKGCTIRVLLPAASIHVRSPG